MDRMKPVFKALNEELLTENIKLEIICVGGYVLEYYGIRGTRDVDAFFKSSYKIEAMIYRVGQRFKLNTAGELWLNNSVGKLNRKPPESICETLYIFSNLIVKMAPIEYVLGMKLESLRGQDLKDMGDIIRRVDLKSPFSTYDMLREFGFYDVDFSMLLEVFSYAYGMDWLEAFFKENEDKIRQYY